MQSRGAAVDFSSVSEYNKDAEVDALCDKVYTIDEIRAIATPIAKSHGVAALYLFGPTRAATPLPKVILIFGLKRDKSARFFSSAASFVTLKTVSERKPMC